MKQRVILHCDANNFYASCECVLNPDLIDKPVAVTGNPEKRTGIILAKNYIAKNYGISTGEVIWQAKQKCPDLVCVSPKFSEYEKFSKKLQKIYQDYTDQVEAFSIDECWLDVTDTQKFFGDGYEIAMKIKERVKKEVGITISVGVSFCKLFAKLGSDLKKPDAITVISESNFRNRIYHLPVTSIMGIGRQTEQTLKKLGVSTLGEYARLPDEVLLAKFGKNGIKTKQALLGNDTEPVKKIGEYDPIKSIGNGTTAIVDIKNQQDMQSMVMFLSDEIATRLRAKRLMASCINVNLRSGDLCWTGKSKTLSYYTNTERDIYKEAMALISTFWNGYSPIRSVRISCSTLISDSAYFQCNLFENTDKKQKLNQAIDQVRKKFGYNAISSLATKNPKIINPDLLRLDGVDEEE